MVDKDEARGEIKGKDLNVGDKMRMRTRVNPDVSGNKCEKKEGKKRPEQSPSFLLHSAPISSA